MLAGLIEADDRAARDAALDALVRDHVRPLLDRIIGRFRRSEPLTNDDAAELESRVLVRLIHRLHSVPEEIEEAIEQLENYVATLTYHTLYDLRRERFPERTRLKNRLRYVLTHDDRLALWQAEGGSVAGLAAWHGAEAFARSFDYSTIVVTPQMRNAEQPADAVVLLLRAKGSPVPFDALVGVVAELWNVRDSGEELPAPQASSDVLTELAGRQYLALLWREIIALPARQRTALLLNLRDIGGANALTLFLLLGIATLPDIAAAIEVSAEELVSLWDELPFDDMAIAGRLGISRQQVINLRKAARARLARRTVHLK